MRNKALDRDQVIRVLAGAEDLLPALDRVRHARALEAAKQLGILAFDARCIALAMQLKVRLVTEDAKLRAAVPSWTVPLASARV